MTDNLQELINTLAKHRGLGEAYYDHRGELRHFSAATRTAILQAMGLPVADEHGMRAAAAAAIANEKVAAQDSSARPICFQPDVFETKKCWGLSIQLYTLRSERNWGIGDFKDLCDLIELAAPLGCDVIGINPLHALFIADPLHCSPYSPSNRLFLNILNIAIDAIPEYAKSVSVQTLCEQQPFQAALTALRVANNVMYEQVSSLKICALRLLFDEFREQLTANTERAQAFRRFVTDRGASLRWHATFEALDKHFCEQENSGSGWQQWPSDYQDPQSPAVQTFAAEHADEIEFFMYAQWLADEQLAAAQTLSLAKGMQIGLYGDLAVGANPSGSEVWANQSLYVQGASVGAPPDPLALNGQDWGIPPIDPHALRASAFAPFIELLRANMSRVGALRVDHVMSLFRLWWVPRGFNSSDGVYVHYPLEALVQRLAHISDESRCLIIGEDLGTVPDEVRHAMDVYRLFQYKVLLFEKIGSRFKSPGEYAQRSVATVTTHDLPPLKAWWQSDDIELRETLGLYPTAETANHLRHERDTDRRELLMALTAAGLWHWQAHETIPEYSLSLSRAIHLYLGNSQGSIVLVQLEDLIGMTDPVNVPGTHIEHANWQRKLAIATEDIFKSEEVQEMLTALSKARMSS